MGSRAEIGQRYPKTIELDEGQLPPGPSFLRVRPTGKPRVRPVLLRLMGTPDRDSILCWRAIFHESTYSFCIAISPSRRMWASG